MTEIGKTVTHEVTFKWCNESDRVRLGMLYQEGFHLESPETFYQDFPMWDPQIALKNRHQLALFQEDEMVATASLLIRKCLSPRREVGIIGGVVVQKKYQGNGFAKKILNELVNYSIQHLYLKNWVLWTGDDRLYRELNFKSIGIQYRSNEVSQYFKDALLEPLTLKVKRGFNDSLWSYLLKNRPLGFYLNDDIQMLYRKMKNIDWWRLESENEAIHAYIGIGRGIDLPNMIHEWGGQESELSLLLKEIFKVYDNPEWIYSAAHFNDWGFLKKLSVLSEDPLCYFKTIEEPLSKEEEKNLWFWGGDSA